MDRMSKKQIGFGVIAAVFALTLTIFLATSAFTRDVLMPLITGILEIIFTIFTSPPDRTLWTLLLLITLPLLFIQLLYHFVKLFDDPIETEEASSAVKGSAELYTEWVGEMGESSYMNAKLRRTVARTAARAMRYDSVEQMLAEEDAPPRAAEYLSLFTAQQQAMGMMATADMLDETLTWLEGRLEI